MLPSLTAATSFFLAPPFLHSSDNLSASSRSHESGVRVQVNRFTKFENRWELYMRWLLQYHYCSPLLDPKSTYVPSMMYLKHKSLHYSEQQYQNVYFLISWEFKIWTSNLHHWVHFKHIWVFILQALNQLPQLVIPIIDNTITLSNMVLSYFYKMSSLQMNPIFVSESEGHL